MSGRHKRHRLNDAGVTLQTLRVIERLFALADFVEGRRFGVTRADCSEEFPEWYADPGKNGKRQRQFYRDVGLLLDLRPIVRVGSGNVGTRYVRADRAWAVEGTAD